jgi:hypothetical protein
MLARTHLSQEGAKKPYKKDDGGQDLDDDNSRSENEPMQVERLLAAGRPEVEGGSGHTIPYSPGE